MLLTVAQEAAAANEAYLIWGFILVAVAIVLLVVELLVPSGGLIGLLCGVAVIGSVVAFFRYDSTWGIAAALFYMILAPITIVFIFKVWLHSPLGRRMILGGDVDNQTSEWSDDEGQSELARRERLAQLQALIGAEGRTVTTLRPVGVVKINDQRIDALAETGIIAAGTTVVVTDVYDNQIKVRPVPMEPA